MKYIFQGITRVFDSMFGFAPKRSKRMEEIMKRAKEPVTWKSLGDLYAEPSPWGKVKDRKPKG